MNGTTNFLNVAVMICTIIGSVAVAAVWLSHKIRPTIQLTHRLAGDPGDERNGIPARPGILERVTQGEKRDVQTQERLDELAAVLAELRQDLAVVKGQVTNNGGSSMKDKQDRMAVTSERLLTAVQQLTDAGAGITVAA